jgi:hypothetical protein
MQFGNTSNHPETVKHLGHGILVKSPLRTGLEYFGIKRFDGWAKTDFFRNQHDKGTQPWHRIRESATG